MASQITIPSVVLYLQGGVNTLFGVYGLLQPTPWRDQLSTNFGSPAPEPAAVTISLQLISMGIFTLFAASRASLHRRALIARTFLHLLAAGMFWRMGVGKMRDGAVLDAIFALMSVGAIPFVKL